MYLVVDSLGLGQVGPGSPAVRRPLSTALLWLLLVVGSDTEEGGRGKYLW